MLLSLKGEMFIGLSLMSSLIGDSRALRGRGNDIWKIDMCRKESNASDTPGNAT